MATATKRRVKLTLNEDEVRLLYVLAVREATECTLTHVDGGIAGPRAEHKDAGMRTLAKLADVMLELQEGRER